MDAVPVAPFVGEMLKRRTVNQKAIAEECGVHRSTVASILNGGALAQRYKEETRNKVLAAAGRLNYHPNRAAQTIRQKRSNLIAIVYFGSGIEAADKTNRELSKRVIEAGYDFLAVDMNWHGGSVHRTLSELIQARVEGVLISHIQHVFADEHIRTLHGAGIPVVSVNGQDRAGVPLVCTDFAAAFAGLTRHLQENGCRTILQLAPDLGHAGVRSVMERIRGFRAACESGGTWTALSEEDFFRQWPARPYGPPGGWTVLQDRRLYDETDRPVYRFCQRLFPLGRLPDALVCLNDCLAMEALFAAREFGLDVPRDVAVTGFDNDRMGAFPALGLTTADQDIPGLCARGVEILLDLIRDPRPTTTTELFPARPIVRSSGFRRKGGNFRPEI